MMLHLSYVIPTKRRTRYVPPPGSRPSPDDHTLLIGKSSLGLHRWHATKTRSLTKRVFFVQLGAFVSWR
jgi:hypothetical protein